MECNSIETTSDFAVAAFVRLTLFTCFQLLLFQAVDKLRPQMFYSSTVRHLTNFDLIIDVDCARTNCSWMCAIKLC